MRAEGNQSGKGLKGSKEGDGWLPLPYPPCSTKESKVFTAEVLSLGTGETFPPSPLGPGQWIEMGILVFVSSFGVAVFVLFWSPH